MNYRTILENFSNIQNNHITPLEIIHDKEKIKKWQINRKSELGKEHNKLESLKIGIVLDDPYILVVRDLVKFPGGKVDGYCRVINRADLVGGKGVAMLCRKENKFLLLHQFRHPIRSWSFEIPRGFGEPQISPENQARNEIKKEIGGTYDEPIDLGVYHINTGLEATEVQLYLINLINTGSHEVDEGIDEMLWVSLREFEEMISSGRITDGFTIAAYTRAKLVGLLNE